MLVANKKGKGSQYSITKRRVPEPIPVLGSQPASDVSHKPGGRLPLLSARPSVTSATLKRAATNFAAWWTKARWVWTVCLRLLLDSVATATWTRAFCAWVQHANHSAIEPPGTWLISVLNARRLDVGLNRITIMSLAKAAEASCFKCHLKRTKLAFLFCRTCVPWILYTPNLYTHHLSPKRPPFHLWITLSKINQFNDFIVGLC